jgi:hypothetical protein
MHMRLHIHQLGIGLSCHFRHDLSITVTGGNCQIGSRGTFIYKVPVLWRILGKDQREAGPVRGLLSRSRVVHVEDDVGTFRYKLRGLIQVEILRAKAWVKLA